MDDEEEKTCFCNQGHNFGSNHKNCLMEEKKRVTKIVELKQKTKCKKCGKKRHWECECLNYKK